MGLNLFICSHIDGFVTADSRFYHFPISAARESVIDTMTDLCHHFLVQFTRHMGAAADRRAQYGSDGFPVGNCWSDH